MAGRPAKQKDGKVGRFGWKAQKPSLEDFALTACAVELGLNVPGHEQAGVPLKPDYKAPGLDMNQAECDALVSYLRNLPTPVERKPATAQEAVIIGAGHKLFASVGCAACHVEKVGTASGIYSDLLLHDMGPELGDSGSYGVFTPDAPEEEQDDSAQPVATVPNGSNPQGANKDDAAAVGQGGRRIAAGMADAAALGRARFGPLFARWPSRHARTSDRLPRRPGYAIGAQLLQSQTGRAAATDRVLEIAHRA